MTIDTVVMIAHALNVSLNGFYLITLPSLNMITVQFC